MTEAGRILYANAISNYCAKVRIVLRAKGLSWRELPPPDGYGTAAYRAVVPAGTIPGLVDDGLVISESEVINEYLDERYPVPAMLPADPAGRATARLIARWHDVRVEPPLRQLFVHMVPGRRDAAFVADRVAEMQRRLDQLGALIDPRPFGTGPNLSLADVAWPATFVLMDHMLAALERPWVLSPPLEAWRRALEAHPAVAPEVAAYHRAAADWVALKLSQ